MELKDIITDGISPVEFEYDNDGNFMIDAFHKWINSEWSELYQVNCEESLECEFKELESVLNENFIPRNKITFDRTGIKHRNFESVKFIEYISDSDKELRVGILSYCDICFGGLDLYCNLKGKEFLEKLISQ